MATITGSSDTMPKVNARVSISKRVARLVIYILLIVGGIVYTVPFVWMVSTSLTDRGAASASPALHPGSYRLGELRSGVDDPSIWRLYA